MSWGNLDSGSGGGISVPSDQIFTDNSARDSFFVANPSKLSVGAKCVVKSNPPEGLYQVYSGSAWENHTAAIIGPSGANGTNGTNGVDGLSVSSATINQNGHLIITMSDNSTIDAGLVSTGGVGDVIHAGDVTDTVDPMLDSWGSPTQATAMVMGTVTDEFVNAPTNISAGEYRGVITKSFGADFVDLTYTTLNGRMYKKIKFVDNSTPYTSEWEELGVSAKEAIWILKDNTASTACTTGGPIMLSAESSKFNAVEQDFLGDLNLTGTQNKLEFTVGKPGAFEIQIHGAIEDPSNLTQKIAITIYDSTTNDHMTGSMQILSPAAAWGLTNEYTFNCTGFARLDPNETVSLQVMVDADATLILRECIVILKPIEY